MIYILQFLEPIGNPNNVHGQCEYYVGYSENVNKRYLQHKKGYGCALTRAANKLGIDYEIVCLIEGDRAAERWIKNRRNIRRVLKNALKGKLPYPVYYVSPSALFRKWELNAMEIYLWQNQQLGS